MRFTFGFRILLSIAEKRTQIFRYTNTLRRHRMFSERCVKSSLVVAWSSCNERGHWIPLPREELAANSSFSRKQFSSCFQFETRRSSSFCRQLSTCVESHDGWIDGCMHARAQNFLRMETTFRSRRTRPTIHRLERSSFV